MKNQAKDKFPKNRKPIIVLICEGRNKTERNYFNHFNFRQAAYSLKIENSEATDIVNMASKARKLYKDWQLDKSLGDHVFCLIDLDLDENKFSKYTSVKACKSNKDIEFIISNPCFEIWLLYYFTANPKVESSSQKVKEQLSKYVPNYTEATDVVKVCDLEMQYAVAINRSEKKNFNYQDCVRSVDRNPFTEIQDILAVLLKQQ